jgi:predicted Zn-dependent protease with MMP-like domain
MSDADFETLVNRAYESLPLKWRQQLSNVGVCVDDRYLKNHNVLGLYEGVSLTRRGSNPSGLLPDKITLFRETILEVAQRTDGDVYRVVHETLVHEIAHHFGWSDAQIKDVFEAWWKGRREA